MRIGVDIGGTFTDLVLVDENSGTVRLGKLLTTPDNPTRAVMDGIARLLHDAGVAARVVRALVHGTTLVTNAIIERKGAKTALITTRGFRDTLEDRARRPLRHVRPLHRPTRAIGAAADAIRGRRARPA